MNDLIRLSEEVGDAIGTDYPLVALESTVITHGLPNPQNLETAQSMERAVREAGAVPATIAVLDGMLKVGLTSVDLERLAAPGAKAVKASRRDLSLALRSRSVAGTTVAATMAVAAMAGIDVFATGGIGGVHTDVDETMDVSADLHELASTNVTVVCAGVKSILDIARTLEHLETLGVPVLGYGSHVFPGFLTRETDYEVEHRVDTADDVAEIVRLRRRLGERCGMLVANPVPAEHSLDRRQLDEAITRVLSRASDRGVSGKEVTPYLLAELAGATNQRSVKANVALLENNARVAAGISAALSRGNGI